MNVEQRRRVLWRVPWLAALVTGAPTIALSLLSTTPAWAQTIGVATLSGKVVDTQSKAPVADAVVTVTSPALQGEQTVVTDGSGFYRVPNLPPGDYTLRVEADRYRVYARGGIGLRANITVRLDVEVLPETLTAEEVTVVGRPPTVDVGSTTSGLNINSDFIQRLPLAPPAGKNGAGSSFEQLSEAVPTGGSDLYGGSIAGSSSPENGYIVDGVSVSEASVGLAGSPTTLEFVKEANLVTGGYLPEYGRSQGGVFDIVTKSGSNEFHGGIFANVTPIVADPKLIQRQETISRTRKLVNTQALGATLGGPIIKDKLWFFAGFQVANTAYNLQRDLNSFLTNPDGSQALDQNNLGIPVPIAGATRNLRATSTQYQAMLKFDFRLDQNNQISVSGRTAVTSTGGNGYFSINPQTGLPEGAQLTGSPRTLIGRRPSQAHDLILKWSNSSMNKRLLFDTTIGGHFENNTGASGLPNDGSQPGNLDPGKLSGQPQINYQASAPFHRITDFETLPGNGVICNDVGDDVVRCPVTQYTGGGAGFIQKASLYRAQVREVVTYLFEGLGHHVIKVGGEIEYNQVNNTNAQSGLQNYGENGSGSAWISSRNYGYGSAPDQITLFPKLEYTVRSFAAGAFAQDSWSIMDRVTLNAGIRYDTQTIYNGQGDIALAMPNQFAPRLGLIYDPTQQGKAKLFTSFAIYYQSVPARLAYRGGSGEPSAISSVPAAACDPTDSAQTQPGGACLDPALKRTLNNGPNSPDRWFRYIAGRTFVDPDLKPQSSNEFQAGGEYEIVPQGRLGVTYLRKWTNAVIEDMSRDEASTYFIGNPGYGIAKDFPKVERVYDAGILHFTKAFADDWLAQASYTLSYLRGNWEGYFRAATGQLDPGTNSDFDLQSLLVNRNGPLPADQRHELKFFVAKDWALDKQNRVTTGASYRARSGGPTNILGAHSIYGTDEVFILPRGEGERLPWVHNVDAHLAYALYRTKDQSLQVTVDIFNLFNFQAAQTTDETYTTAFVNPIRNAPGNAYDRGNKLVREDLITTSDGSGEIYSNEQRNPNFGRPASYQQPLQVRFGIRTTF
jgi:carboxypeptidase family protein/TonB-dependent receptor-like protein